jgi:thiamine biosynthesis protein ThiS
MTSAQREIEISVNGQDKVVPAGQSVAQLLALLGLERDRVAVELNRAIVRKPDWERTEVGAGAAVEIVHFVGGGRQ